GVGRVHVASRSVPDDALAASVSGGSAHRDYARALAETPPGLVYVSLVNAAHVEWVEAALAAGHHVVVDKPAVLALADAERLVARAAARGLLLAEATTYAWHPLVPALRAVFAEHGAAPAQVTATFTPPVPANDFRHRRASGGGALADLGPYAVSVGRLLWDADPVGVSAVTVARGPEVETAFSALLDYGGGRVVAGHFGFTSEYQNRLHALGPALSVEAERVFSAAPGEATRLLVRHRDATEVREIAPGDAMAAFLGDALGAIAAGDVDRFGATLLRDARALARLRAAAA
ncbi:MAG: Gfo/Idh/MocA family oxidoreductase, partial [Myxococcales bacterium]|nr:Gfo/Idh/MocA family oxidoreductase [Myxococcales bacterium]